ncbi:MAG: ParB N-terminal domain-containing protein [Solirubrobacteraceae bacterium]
MGGKYLLIAGERRYCAALEAQLAEIPAIVKRSDPDGDRDEQRERTELTIEALIEKELRERRLRPAQHSRRESGRSRQPCQHGISSRSPSVSGRDQTVSGQQAA